MSFREWRLVKLDEANIDIIDGDRGNNYPKKNEFYSNGHCLFLNAKNVTSEGFSFNEVMYIDKDKDKLLRKGKLKRRDVILTTRGTVGNVAFYGDNIKQECIRINSGMVIIRADETEYDSEFIYWLFRSPIIQEQISSIRTGSAQPQLPINIMKTLKFKRPPLQEQKAIAHIISTLDDKIETNNKINKTLEEMAQAIFKHWFVDFEFPNEDGEPYKSSGGEMVDSELGPIPKGWEVKSIYSLADFIYGAPFSSKLFNERAEGLPLIRIRDLKTGNPQFYTNEQHRNSTIVEPGDILIGMDAEFKPTVWKGKRAVLNQRVCLLRPRNSNIHRYYLYELVKPHMRSLEFSKTGTTVIHFGKSDVDSIMIVHPSFNLLKAFNNLITPIHGKLVNISIENRTLASIRDTLLPKLMSGEIRVPIDIEE